MLLKRHVPFDFRQWHCWFAWRPVFAAASEPQPYRRDVPGGVVWLEEVERRWSNAYYEGGWDYRRLGTPSFMKQERVAPGTHAPATARNPEGASEHEAARLGRCHALGCNAPAVHKVDGGWRFCAEHTRKDLPRAEEKPGRSCGQCGGGPCPLCDS
jgi:hypothetical protein